MEIYSRDITWHKRRSFLEAVIEKKMLRLLGCVLFAVYIVESRKIVDLTHTFDQDNPKYPLKNIIGNEAYKNLEYYRLRNLYSDYINGDFW
jgi:hypothetical protein